MHLEESLALSGKAEAFRRRFSGGRHQDFFVPAAGSRRTALCGKRESPSRRHQVLPHHKIVSDKFTPLSRIDSKSRGIQSIHSTEPALILPISLKVTQREMSRAWRVIAGSRRSGGHPVEQLVEAAKGIKMRAGNAEFRLLEMQLRQILDKGIGAGNRQQLGDIQRLLADEAG